MKGSPLLTLWVTTDCNLRCRYCYACGGDSAEYMNWNVAKQAIDIMSRCFGSFTIQFAGGEPVLNMALIEQVVHYTKGRDIIYQLQTNATLIDPDLARNLKLLEIYVGVSLDGMPGINDSLRPFPDGHGSTSAAVAGLKNLGSAGIRVGLTCVLSSENIAGLPDLVDLSSYLSNIEGITFDLLRPTGRAKENCVEQADPASIAMYIKTALERSDELTAMGGKKVKFREAEKMQYRLSKGLERRYRCHFDAGLLLLVRPGGKAYPCPSLADFSEFCLGNVLDQDFEYGLRAGLQESRKLIGLPDNCIQCNKRWLCAGPCPAWIYTQNDFQKPGNIEPGECSINRTFLNYIREKEIAQSDSTETKQINLSV